MNILSINAVNSGLKSSNYINNKKINFSGINYHEDNNANIEDYTDLYKPEEIEAILKRLGVNTKMPFDYPAKYTVELYPSGTMIINNKSMTNDTTEISPDGSAIHVGSWHRKELAKAGECNDILNDFKQRIENKK